MATARMASLSSKSLACLVLSAQVTAPGRRSCRRRPPTAGPGGRCRACRRPVPRRCSCDPLSTPALIGDVAGQPERWCAACGRRQQDPGGQNREDQAEQAGDAHDRQCSATGRAGPPGTGEDSWQTMRRWRLIERPIRRVRPAAPGGRAAEGCRAAGDRLRTPHRFRPGPGPGAALRGAAAAGRQDAGRRAAPERHPAHPADALVGGRADRPRHGDRAGLRPRPRRHGRARSRHRAPAVRAQR